MAKELVVVGEVAGELQGEMIRGLLEAQGIPVMLSEESAARAIGISIPAMGTVKVIVPEDFAAVARQMLDEYFSGALPALPEDEVTDKSE